MKIEHILVIDDNDTDLLIAKIILERSNFGGSITTQTSAKAGLEYLKELQSKGTAWPNIIFLDINMPLVNGYGFIQEFEKFEDSAKNSTNIIMLSSSDNKTDLDTFLNKSYVKDFISKPISPDSLKIIFDKFS